MAREVASFMQMYPAYKLRDVLEEYAIVFFNLLNDGYRIQYGHYKLLAIISRSANIKDSDFRRLVDSLERASRGFDDILNPSDPSSPDELKRALR